MAVNNKVVEPSRRKGARTTPLVEGLVKGGPSLSHLPAKAWGCKHEQDAVNAFKSQETVNHVNLSVEQAGLFVKGSLSYIGATLDAVVRCECHGSAPLECKCPYSVRDQTIQDSFKKTDFLEQAESGEMRLKRNHTYFYQIQAQIAVTDTKFGYFCVWTGNGPTFVEVIEAAPEWWKKVEQNLMFFFKAYVSQYLEGLRCSHTAQHIPRCVSKKMKSKGMLNLVCVVIHATFGYIGNVHYIQCALCLDT
ncbi:uncharacterized protein LOC119721730 [Patiria miniata]|uniref:YqaJ viral recombinase domain-containing protein n=1 Tax=Patiria miniata TaxID=46514 RepID=A0A913Z9R5_PATMI|nr:uncharacterized protein LOC119721730 [Patiria miniata]